MKHMNVLGVRVRLGEGDQEVLVLLQQVDGEACVPIVIGPHEGVAIAAAHAHMIHERPSTHELMLEVLQASGVHILAVEITALIDDVFHAELVLSNGARVDSRASDAVALSMLTGAELLCAEEVLTEAGVVIRFDENGNEEAVALADSEEGDLEQFREFLDHVEPEDFLEDSGGDAGHEPGE